jgi:biopolymer transport protein ExbD
MKRFQTTIGLTVVLLMLCGWRGYQWRRQKQTAQRGLPVVLSYPCSYPESFNVLGDDRQIVVRYEPNGSMWVNQTLISEPNIGSEMERIFETRNYKLVWIDASPQVTFGQAVHAIAVLRSDKTNAIVALSTASQLASKAVDANGYSVAFCPYTSHPEAH